ncbi:hypothetical protein Bca4012_068298 [Brassica carinata]
MIRFFGLDWKLQVASIESVGVAHSLETRLKIDHPSAEIAIWSLGRLHLLLFAGYEDYVFGSLGCDDDEVIGIQLLQLAVRQLGRLRSPRFRKALTTQVLLERRIEMMLLMGIEMFSLPPDKHIKPGGLDSADGKMENKTKVLNAFQNPELMKYLKHMTRLKLLNFQGISKIETIDDAICTLHDLIILDFKACYDVEKLRVKIYLL